MEFKKLIPWNWFHKEEKEDMTPVRKEDGNSELHPVLQLHREFDRLFDQMLRGFPLTASQAPLLARPKVDISETESEYRLELELPGVDMKDVELSVRNGVLVVRGEKKSCQENRNSHRIERYYGSFQRMFSLPEDCDEEKIEARFQNGVLFIEVGRKPVSAAGVRRIPIKQSEPARQESLN
jgi:HSP20 family protein